MKFWKIYASEYRHGPEHDTTPGTRYLSFGFPVVEVRDKALKKSTEKPAAVVLLHYGHQVDQNDGAHHSTAWYEIAGMTAAEAVKEIEALHAPAAPVKDATASLGVLPVGMMG